MSLDGPLKVCAELPALKDRYEEEAWHQTKKKTAWATTEGPKHLGFI
jgi:hypothetical protein